jgi:S-adenosylhomocysteine hydrolase
MFQNTWQSFASQIATNDDDHSTVEFLNRKPAVMLMAGQLILLCGTGKVGKIWSACGKHEIHCTE